MSIYIYICVRVLISFTKMMNTHVDIVWHIIVSILQYKNNYNIIVKHNLVLMFFNLEIGLIFGFYFEPLLTLDTIST